MFEIIFSFIYNFQYKAYDNVGETISNSNPTMRNHVGKNDLKKNFPIFNLIKLVFYSKENTYHSSELLLHLDLKNYQKISKEQYMRVN